MKLNDSQLARLRGKEIGVLMETTFRRQIVTRQNILNDMLKQGVLRCINKPFQIENILNDLEHMSLAVMKKPSLTEKSP